MAHATLTISSRNYSSWSLRGWLLCRLAGLEFETQTVSLEDPTNRAELLLLSPSVLVPRLTHGRVIAWDTLAIAEYLNEAMPDAHMWPIDRIARAHARAVSGEMHSGFSNLRSALPMNLRARYPGFKVWAGAQSDIERVFAIWRECLATYGGPYLFGQLSAADAMYAPVCTRFQTYDVSMDSECQDYCARVLGWAPLAEWVAEANGEAEEIEELEVEF
jgi:glutathione S-transferase